MESRRLNDVESRPLSVARTRIDLPSTDATQPIVVAADSANCWTRGAYEVWAMRGNCAIEQGRDIVRGREAVVWLRHGDPTEGRRSLVIVYMEGDVVLDVAQKGPPARLTDQSWLGRWETVGNVQVRVPEVHGAPEPLPPIYARAVAARDGGIVTGVRQAQYTEPTGPAAPAFGPGAIGPGAIGPTRPGSELGTPPLGGAMAAASLGSPAPAAGPARPGSATGRATPGGALGSGPFPAASRRPTSSGSPTATPTCGSR